MYKIFQLSSRSRTKTAPSLCPNKTRLRAVSAGPQNPWRTIYKHPGKPGERRGTSKTYPPLEPKGKQCGGKGTSGMEVGRRQRKRVVDGAF